MWIQQRLALLFLSFSSASSFWLPRQPSVAGRTVDDSITTTTTRRGFGQQLAGLVGASCLVSAPLPSWAAGQEDLDEKAKLKKGYDRLNYLLDNWDKLTTVCGRTDNPYQGKNGCERSPLVVMDYMGYKSMNDPLFKADKTLKRLSALVPADDSVDYLEAMEKFGEASEEASGMAYVSSWGEANPGGGKDRVEYWIERSKKNVTDARDSLGVALRILGQI